MPFYINRVLFSFCGCLLNKNECSFLFKKDQFQVIGMYNNVTTIGSILLQENQLVGSKKEILYLPHIQTTDFHVWTKLS